MSDSEQGDGPPEEADSHHVPDAQHPDIARSRVVYGDQENTPEQQAQAERWEPPPLPPLDWHAWDPQENPAPDWVDVEHRISDDPDQAQQERSAWYVTRDRYALAPASFLREKAKQPLEWLVPALLPTETYGFLAGPEKSYKTHQALALAVSVAGGVPLYGADTLPAPDRAAVAFLSGEGNQRTLGRWLVRIADAMGADSDTLDQWLLTLERPGQMGDPRFAERVARQVYVEEVKLVILDPLYAFHGGEAEMTNLFAQGRLLSEFTHQVLEAGASLLVVHHTKKTESGPPDLRSLAGAGGGEWPDSWLLTWHLAPPDPQAGEYHLGLSMGSRQTAGSFFELRWSDGPFDWDGGHHQRPPQWEFTRADASLLARRGEQKVSDDSLAERVLALCATPQTGRMLETSDLGAGAVRVRAARTELVEQGALVTVRWHHKDAGGRPRTDDAWVRSELAPPPGPDGVRWVREEGQ